MTTTMTPVKKPSQSSVNYLTDLVRKRQSKPGLDATASLAALTKWLADPARTQKDVSKEIDRVKALPLRTVFAPVPVGTKTAYVPYPAVPEAVPTAKFAIMTELLQEIPPNWKGQEYLFFEVKTLKGKRVVRRLLGAPGKFKRNFLPAALATELFGHLENPEFAFTASRTFGEIYSVCGRCAAELTDDTSRERKFGPICWDLLSPWMKHLDH